MRKQDLQDRNDVARHARASCLLLVVVVSVCSCRHAQPSSKSAPGAKAASATVDRRTLSGIPADYVATPKGYFHPSCIVHVKPSERVVKGGFIETSDGRKRKAPSCSYPHYTNTGTRTETPSEQPGRVVTESISHAFAARAYRSTSGSGVVQIWSRWAVPDSHPSVDDGQILFYFPGLQNRGYDRILQPVLSWAGGQWKIDAIDADDKDNVWAGDPVNVAEGDVLESSIEGVNCDQMGKCASWLVSIRDVTTDRESWLHIDDEYVGSPLPNVEGGDLEVYSINTCDDFSLSSVFFHNIRIKLGDGTDFSPPSWTIRYGFSLPGCAWDLQTSGNDVELKQQPPPCPVACSCGGCSNSQKGCEVLCDPCTTCSDSHLACCANPNTGAMYCARRCPDR